MCEGERAVVGCERWTVWVLCPQWRVYLLRFASDEEDFPPLDSKGGNALCSHCFWLSVVVHSDVASLSVSIACAALPGRFS